MFLPGKRSNSYSECHEAIPKIFLNPLRRNARSLRCLRQIPAKNYSENEDKKSAVLESRSLNILRSATCPTALISQFKRPLEEQNKENRVPAFLGTKKRRIFISRPLYDPHDDFAVVLFDSTIDEGEIEVPRREERSGEGPTKIVKGRSLADILKITGHEVVTKPVAVVIDPKLTSILRPHQIEGVKFLWQATTGRLDPENFGCIMADEMGLGKTLQCITLLWTLLKQSPFPGRSTIEKCMIICPSSLVKNWAHEIDKWLGKGSLKMLVLDGKLSKDSLEKEISHWARAKNREITRPGKKLEAPEINPKYFQNHEIGLILCDEGHRLKNCESQTFNALSSLDCKRRIILSGTPIQNDLSEYFSLLNFTNPTLLGSKNRFRKNFENAILQSRDADSTEEQRKKGDDKLVELAHIVNPFIIRRTNDILSKYLPRKYEHVVFIRLADIQKKLYCKYLKCSQLSKSIKARDNASLQSITLLKKLCNHPNLLDLPKDIDGCDHILPNDFSSPYRKSRSAKKAEVCWSGKFTVLDRMLDRMYRETDDRVVLISNYTQSLDILELFCRQRRYSFLRLDGTLNIRKRQALVEKFNNPLEDYRIFLLSSKAGGCGLNLIGANRLILFDPDWNPAADQQALARVWRDGQKKNCFVYRFISTGTIEEKIFQRQSHKQSLSSCVVDEAKNVGRHFSYENLKSLFNYREDTDCDTHDSFNCKRCKDGKQVAKSPAILYGDSSTWNHIHKESLQRIDDILLRDEYQERQVSYCFQYICMYYLSRNDFNNLAH